MDGLRGKTFKGTGFELIASSDDDFGAGFKECSKCGDSKPLVEFHKGKAMCKMCRRDHKPPKIKTHNDDMVYQAMVDAAYRIIKESM